MLRAVQEGCIIKIEYAKIGSYNTLIQTNSDFAIKHNRANLYKLINGKIEMIMQNVAEVTEYDEYSMHIRAIRTFPYNSPLYALYNSGTTSSLILVYKDRSSI